MYRKIMTLAISAIACSLSLNAGFWDSVTAYVPRHVHTKPVGVKVLLDHQSPGVKLGVRGKYKIYDPNTKELISTRFVGKQRMIEPYAEGIRWAEEFPGLYQLLIVTDDPRGSISINDMEYGGAVYIYNVGGALSIINELPVEDYLNGLLAGLYQEPLDSETLAAVAIAARTDALFQIAHPRNPYWTIDARHVGYQGRDAVNPSGPVAQAIAETRGMILTIKEMMTQEAAQELAQSVFPARWGGDFAPKIQTDPSVLSKITLDEADKMAKEGTNAVEILFKAFPGSKIAMQ